MTYNFDKIIDRTNTNSLKYERRKALFKNENAIPLWVADMDLETPDFIINAIKKRIEHPILGYTLKPDSYNQSIINWFKTRHNWQIEQDWITFSPGVVPALGFCVLAYTNPGDKVLLQSPIYYPFFTSISNNSREIVDNVLKLNGSKYEIDFVDFEEKIKTGVKLFLLCNPHNPGSRVWKTEELKKMAEICLANNVIIVSDLVSKRSINNLFNQNLILKESIV